MLKKLSKPVLITVCVFLVTVTGILYFLWDKGVFVTDHSAQVIIEDMNWNDKGYSVVSGKYTEGRTIAKSKDGGWKINEVKEDLTHTFVVARSFLDRYLYAADDYDVPKSGNITKVFGMKNI